MGRYIGELKKLDVKNNASRFSIEVLKFRCNASKSMSIASMYHYQQNIIFKYFAKEDWCL
jgi:hypothetical protein